MKRTTVLQVGSNRPARYGNVTVRRTEQEEQKRATKSEASEDFAPVSMKLRPVGDNSIAIVTEDAEGNYRGITVDEHILPALGRVLAIGSTRLLDYWRTYDSERGGDYMLWDICRICRAIKRCTEVPTLKGLVKFDGAYNIMHNAYQAELIAEASERFPGAVRMASARRDTKHGDFEMGAALLRGPFLRLFIGVCARGRCLLGSFCGGQA